MASVRSRSVTVWACKCIEIWSTCSTRTLKRKRVLGKQEGETNVMNGTISACSRPEEVGRYDDLAGPGTHQGCKGR